jgi:hypothetical protein
MPVSRQDFDNWIIRSCAKHGFQLVGMGVKPADGKDWAAAYLFKHDQDGTHEFPRYYIWEVLSIPGNLKHVSAAASESAKRNRVEFYGKLPRGSCRGDNPPWEGNPEENEDSRGAVSTLKKRADAAWKCCISKRDDTLDQMAPLIQQSLITFGVSARFFSIMTVLDKARAALEEGDFETAKGELHSLLIMCGMLRRDLAPVYDSPACRQCSGKKSRT